MLDIVEVASFGNIIIWRYDLDELRYKPVLSVKDQCNALIRIAFVARWSVRFTSYMHTLGVSTYKPFTESFRDRTDLYSIDRCSGKHDGVHHVDEFNFIIRSVRLAFKDQEISIGSDQHASFVVVIDFS